MITYVWPITVDSVSSYLARVDMQKISEVDKPGSHVC